MGLETANGTGCHGRRGTWGRRDTDVRTDGCRRLIWGHTDTSYGRELATWQGGGNSLSSLPSRGRALTSPILTDPLDHFPPSCCPGSLAAELLEVLPLLFPVSLLPFSHKPIAFSPLWPQDSVEPALVQVTVDPVVQVTRPSVLVYFLLWAPRAQPSLGFPSALLGHSFLVTFAGNHFPLVSLGAAQLLLFLPAFL